MKIYAMGDVHGMKTQMHDALHQAGLVDGQCNWIAEDTTLVCLGDYIDRGWDSKGVIDNVIKIQAQAPAKGSKVIALWGNHERMVIDGLTNHYDGDIWLSNGGRKCAISYDLGMLVFGGYSAKVSEKILEVHGEFFDSLKHYHVEGDTLFVHAGLDSSRTIDQINMDDDIVHLWVRAPFFQHSDPATYLEKNYGVKRVVFGHTIHREGVTPYFGGQYLCVDTGSFLEDGAVSVVELLPDLKWRLAGQGR